MARNDTSRRRKLRVLVAVLLTLVELLFLLPQFGGTRQPKEMLSEKAFIFAIVRSDAGDWFCRSVSEHSLESSAGILEEVAASSDEGVWVAKVDEIAIHWLGFIPGDKHLSMSWRVSTVAEVSENSAFEYREIERLPEDVVRAISQHVETGIIPARSFPMSDRLSDTKIQAGEGLSWGGGKKLSHPAITWVFFGFILLAASLIGYGASFLIVWPESWSESPAEAG